MLDLNPVLTSRVKSVSFKSEYDLKPYSADITEGKATVTGCCSGHSGYLELKADFDLDLTALCARCAEPFHTGLSFSLTFPVADKLENSEDEDDYIILSDGMLDTDEFCESSIYLNLPSRFLCRDDCKGLCPVCGANLNVSACSCEKKEIDPRLAKLKELLDK